jgi:5-methylcytosine-specific restriction endonuclease McrA
MATKEEQREYMRVWIAKRRSDYFYDKHCVRCGSTEKLELDHVDPAQKIEHRIWSWTKVRRESEIAKCQVLCQTCHSQKSIEQLPITSGIIPYRHGTSRMYRRGCKCGLCKLWKKRENSKRYLNKA